MKTIILVNLCLIIAVYEVNCQWNYDDTRTWHNASVASNMCGGKFQTPVALNINQAEFDSDLPAMSVQVNGKLAMDYLFNTTVVTNGLTVTIAVPEDTRLYFGDKRMYSTRALHIHFHWGSDSNKGSEHSLDGKFYPMEAHLVTFNDLVFGTISQSVVSPTGLAVFGVFFEVVPEGQGLQVMEQITLAMNNADFQAQISGGNTKEVKLNNAPLLSLFEGRMRSYYRYMGSLTTPPCTENVLWSVSRAVVPITETQLNRFRALKFVDRNAPLVNNFRALQELNPKRPDLAKRVITRSFNAASLLRAEASPALSLSLAILVVAVVNCVQ